MARVGAARSAVVYSADERCAGQVARVLERVGVRIAGRATNPGEALRLAAGVSPQFVVLDAERNGVDGPGLIRTARNVASSARVIALVGAGDTQTVKHALAAGAFAVVVKRGDGDANEVAVAARQAFETSLYFAAPAGDEAGYEIERAGLTARELDVLRLVAEGYSNARIARTLWVAEQTVKFHLSNLYRKVGVSNRTQAARWAARHGVLSV